MNQVNHDEFEYKIDVRVMQKVKAAFRIFIAPQFDEHGERLSLAKQRPLFIEMDKFVETCKFLKMDKTVM